jgi:cytochrome oxidase Cu insertion factor (SCO1/SenC/PrrC family)
MKIWILIFLSFIFVEKGFAQAIPTEKSPAEVSKTIPPFELNLVNKGTFSKAQLKKNTPLIIIFFSPTCEHCIHEMNDITKRMKEFDKFQVVMGTFQPLEDLAIFNKKYQLSKHPNFVTGRDEKYILPPYFQIQTFPYFAFYDKKGILLGTHQGNLSVDEILKTMKGGK